MKNNKYLEYYMDSQIYSAEDVKNSIDKTKKEFPNKNVKVTIGLNSFGMYIITCEFEDKNTFFNRIRIFFKRKEKKEILMLEDSIGASNKKEQEKLQKRFEKYSSDIISYGKYKSTGLYRPY